MSKLAINGGPKIRQAKFPPYRVIGAEEKAAVRRVLDSGILSRFLGTWHNDFYGGPEVQALEKEWAKYFSVKYAVTVNSATSGLYAAVGALGINPGDEVIVSPYSMACSATAPLIYGAIPIFADIEEDYFCLSPESIESKITPRTKAIIVVDIFGQPYDAAAINQIAREHNLKIIEDCAQAPFAAYKDKFAGTLGDVGVYSLNYHKHIHTGEGGVIVTNNDELAERLKLIRNHAESVVAAKGYTNLTNMVGFNYRMTEIEAAIGREQLKKLAGLVEERIKNVEYLAQKLALIPCLEPAKVRPNCRHVYYQHVLKFNKNIAGVSREKFVEAVRAELAVTELREGEGVTVNYGYVKPIYLQPMFQQRLAFGNQGYPWTGSAWQGTADYSKGICPVVEKMHEEVLITHDLMRPGLSEHDLNDVAAAFNKVWENINELKNI
jgi:perosamine synthetase